MDILSHFKIKLKFREAIHKVATVSLVVLYYTLVEQVPLNQRLSSNDSSLIAFIRWQHLH